MERCGKRQGNGQENRTLAMNQWWPHNRQCAVIFVGQAIFTFVPSPFPNPLKFNRIEPLNQDCWSGPVRAMPRNRHFWTVFYFYLPHSWSAAMSCSVECTDELLGDGFWLWFEKLSRNQLHKRRLISFGCVGLKDRTDVSLMLNFK